MRVSKLAVPMGVVAIILLLIVPVPVGLLDFLIAANILLALVILMTSMFVKKPLDFSVFPSLLLVATLFRLGLNVASTRLILGEAHAGQIIEAFGQITVGGNIIIGAVIFLILVVIQFIVVTKGAERVAEVGARFTLDAMPGKQMAIDADLNAGLITDEEAKARRAEVSAEADFYGAMDGASKFVKGDAIAGIIILVINIVGGIAIGATMHGMPIMEAVSTYSILTIGDGLVTQIPALLMAVATGMIVTRSNAESDMGTTASNQLAQSRSALMIAGVASIALALIPGMPKVPFVLIGAGLIFASQRIKASETAAALAESAPKPAEPAKPETPEQMIESFRVHPLEIQLSTDLVDIVTGASDDLLARVKALRHKIGMDLGVVVPPVRTRDSVELPPHTYSIRVAGVEAARGQAPAGMVLALGGSLDALPGSTTQEPVFGLDGKWVPSSMAHSAQMAGATVVERVSVLVTHLSSVITANAARLLSREDVRVLTETVKEANPSAVEELVPGLLSLAEVQRVLQGLLAEQVPINDLSRIYEALTLRAKASTDPEGLIEAARRSLGPALASRYMENGELSVITIEPALEQLMLESKRPSDEGSALHLDYPVIEAVLKSLQEALAAASQLGLRPVVACSPVLRPAVRNLISAPAGGLPVLSYNEVQACAVPYKTVGVIRNAAQISA